ncbi:carbon-nitrogen hydrolase family protein [Micromonospora sp. SH-82]|uniref:carbon-nitrogen hydrolase family protein n=1 Tax=Micromonospora sp. SH-82 TaxID=3132938 RepID=UPI003EBCB8D1
MVVAVAQPYCVPYDVSANALAHAEAVRAAEARLVVFPELSLTGYHVDAPVVDPTDRGLAVIVDACAATGSVALVGAPVPGPGGPSIGVLAVDATGARVAYRKMHLGTAETGRFVPGARPAVLVVDGVRLGLAVCRDTGVAAHAAATAALGMDAYVAGVLHTADEAALHGERARRVAADHRVPVVTASFAGGTGEGYDRAAGRSGIWAADGTPVVEAGPEPGAVVRANLLDATVDVDGDGRPGRLG